MKRRTFLKALACAGASLSSGLTPGLAQARSYDDMLKHLLRKGELSDQQARFLVDEDKHGNKRNLWYVPSQVRDKSLEQIARNPSNFHRVSDDTMVQGIWCYPGFQKGQSFFKNPDVIGRRITDGMYAANFETLKLLDEFNVNTVYISALHHFNALDAWGARDDRRKHWADYQNFTHILETFALAANDPELINHPDPRYRIQPKEIAILGYEDTVFLDWDKNRLQKDFSQLIRNTAHIARNYQIDVEPHAMDLKGNYFRNNPSNRELLMEKYLDLCQTMYETAENFNQENNTDVRFIPAVPYIRPPNVPRNESMDYHEILRECGHEGLDAIPCHELILMSYSPTPESLYHMCRQDPEFPNIQTPFTLASSNFPNVWDPYFRTADEHKEMPHQIRKIQEINPNCKGYQIFCNLSLMNENLPIKR
ncbi:MAG: twin-arginine translocation signal domain-containing protein [Nanobdellota archaeon]